MGTQHGIADVTVLRGRSFLSPTLHHCPCVDQASPWNSPSAASLPSCPRLPRWLAHRHTQHAIPVCGLRWQQPRLLRLRFGGSVPARSTRYGGRCAHSELSGLRFWSKLECSSQKRPSFPQIFPHLWSCVLLSLIGQFRWGSVLDQFLWKALLLFSCFQKL